MGSSYESLAAHGNKKAAEQDAALVALEALQAEADERDGASVVGGESVTEPSVESRPLRPPFSMDFNRFRQTFGAKRQEVSDGIALGRRSHLLREDYKGQLLQVHRDARFEVFRVHLEAEEKFFEAAVALEGQRFVSGAVSRSDFESSDKARRAAQQEAARLALQAQDMWNRRSFLWNALEYKQE